MSGSPCDMHLKNLEPTWTRLRGRRCRPPPDEGLSSPGWCLAAPGAPRSDHRVRDNCGTIDCPTERSSAVVSGLWTEGGVTPHPAWGAEFRSTSGPAARCTPAVRWVLKTGWATRPLPLQIRS